MVCLEKNRSRNERHFDFSFLLQGRRVGANVKKEYNFVTMDDYIVLFKPIISRIVCQVIAPHDMFCGTLN